MKKYLIISHKFGDVKRGSYNKSKDFSLLYPNVCLMEDIEFDTFDNIFDYNFDKYIFRTQVYSNYSCGFNPITLRNKNHLVFTRYEKKYGFLNNAVNGFNYYKKYHKNLPNFIPFILPYNTKHSFSGKCIGYYIRKKSLGRSYRMFLDFLDTLNEPLNLYTMGYNEHIIHKNIKTHTHTNNRDDFFNNISHYVYPKSEHADPFPHSLCEAIFSYKQVIIPEIKNRTFRDGIDDLESCVKFHRSWSEKIYDNSNSIIFKDFTGFYNRLMENDFEYKCDPTRYKNFADWIDKEI